MTDYHAQGRPISDLSIDYLANHPDCIPRIAEWHSREWAYLNPNAGLTQHIAKLQKLCKTQSIPTAFIALVDTQPIGSASLVAHDILREVPLTPWLASVYVSPSYRQKGIGTALVQRSVREARILGYERLYLFTPNQQDFYRRLGWKAMHHVVIKGHDMTVMVKRIAA